MDKHRTLEGWINDIWENWGLEDFKDEEDLVRYCIYDLNPKIISRDEYILSWFTQRLFTDDKYIIYC